jgi:hypothetical protein
MRRYLAFTALSAALLWSACGDKAEPDSLVRQSGNGGVARTETVEQGIAGTATDAAEKTEISSEATALALATITPTPMTAVIYVVVPGTPAPGSESPAAGICAEPEEPVVTVIMDVSTPNPRCSIVTPDQRIRIVNKRDETALVVLGGFRASLRHNEAALFDAPAGTYLGTGFHSIVMNGQGFGEVGVLEADDPRRLPN